MATKRLSYASKAVRHLKNADPVLGRLIERLGPFRLEPKLKDETFEALLQSIVYQQLNGKAAATILGRVLAHFDEGKTLTPERLLKTPDEKLRAAGLSANKLLALKDLAQKTIDGVVPPRHLAEKLSDEELVERLTAVRGIGPWTVHMLLIFRFGRPDVLPTGDFAVCKAFGLLYKKRGHPKPEVVHRHAKIWAPYRTVASWYLWRSLDPL